MDFLYREVQGNYGATRSELVNVFQVDFNITRRWWSRILLKIEKRRYCSRNYIIYKEYIKRFADSPNQDSKFLQLDCVSTEAKAKQRTGCWRWYEENKTAVRKCQKPPKFAQREVKEDISDGDAYKAKRRSNILFIISLRKYIELLPTQISFWSSLCFRHSADFVISLYSSRSLRLLSDHISPSIYIWLTGSGLSR